MLAAVGRRRGKSGDLGFSQERTKAQSAAAWQLWRPGSLPSCPSYWLSTKVSCLMSTCCTRDHFPRCALAAVAPGLSCPSTRHTTDIQPHPGAITHNHKRGITIRLLGGGQHHACWPRWSAAKALTTWMHTVQLAPSCLLPPDNPCTPVWASLRTVHWTI